MTKSTVFEGLNASLTEAVAYASGDRGGTITHEVEIEDIDVRGARKKLGLSQDQFAATFGVSASTLRKWEQNERRPTGPARILLRVIEREPDAVKRALEA